MRCDRHATASVRAHVLQDEVKRVQTDVKGVQADVEGVRVEMKAEVAKVDARLEQVQRILLHRAQSFHQRKVWCSSSRSGGLMRCVLVGSDAGQLASSFLVHAAP